MQFLLPHRSFTKMPPPHCTESDHESLLNEVLHFTSSSQNCVRSHECLETTVVLGVSHPTRSLSTIRPPVHAEAKKFPRDFLLGGNRKECQSVTLESE